MARREEKCSGDAQIRRENLRKLLEDRNLTEQELADLTELSLSTINRLLSEKSGRIIHDRHVKKLSKGLKIDPSCFDQPQSWKDIKSITEIHRTPESYDAHINFRPKLSPFSKQEGSQHKQSAIELVKRFHYLGNLEKLTYEELWDHTKEYILQIKQVTKNFGVNKQILIYSMASDPSMEMYFFDELSPLEKYPEVILLSVFGNFSRESQDSYWRNEFKHLKYQLDECKETIKKSNIKATLEIFALAPQPLVVELGHQLNDISKVNILPTYRTNNFQVEWGWRKPHKWRNSPGKIDYKSDKPKIKKSIVALNLSLSSSILDQDIERVLGNDVSVWKLTIDKPDDEFLKGKYQLDDFRTVFSDTLKKIVYYHGKRIELNLFLSVPIAIAFEIGRIWDPSTDPEIVLYGLSSVSGKYYPIHTLSKNE